MNQKERWVLPRLLKSYNLEAKTGRKRRRLFNECTEAIRNHKSFSLLRNYVHRYRSNKFARKNSTPNSFYEDQTND